MTADPPPGETAAEIGRPEPAGGLGTPTLTLEEEIAAYVYLTRYDDHYTDAGIARGVLDIIDMEGTRDRLV